MSAPSLESAARGVFLVALIAAVSCSKILSLEEYSVRAPPVEAGSACGAFDQGSCGECIRDNCCRQAAACRDEPECRTFAECVAKSRSLGGRGLHDCFSAQPKTSAMGAYAACLVTSCPTRCDGCSWLGAPFGPNCAQCAEDTVCNTGMGDGGAGLACLADAECGAFFGCTFEDCATWTREPSCRLKCMGKHPDAHALFHSYVFGGIGSCGAECAWGEHWDCFDNGRIALPPSDAR